MYKEFIPIFLAAQKLQGQGYYGMTNPNEFLSEAITNVEFQDALRTIPSVKTKGNTTLFNDIIEFVKNLIGINTIENTLLEDIFKISERLIKESKFTNSSIEEQAQQLYNSYLQTTNNPTIEGFKQWNNRQQQINELFEQNPELANAIYEASGFNNTNVEEFKGFWTRSDVAKQENKVFLFGDNTNDRTVTKYVPSKTQAVIRGLSNAIGIDTKKDRGTNEGIKVQSENISSKGSEFAKKLTNVGNNIGLIYKGKQYVNSEHAYQTWKSGEFNQEGYNLKGGKVRGGKIGDTFNIMIDILTEKLKQHPDLIKGINERGGLDYISKSTHNVIGDNFWESTGQNKFIEALYQAAINVGIKNNTSSYFTDSDFEWFKNHVDEQIQQAKNSGKTIVIPADGIGTGKAMLKEKAPKLFEYLQQKLNELKNTQITPEQKQKAQELYSSYLQTTNNPTIEGFKQWNNRQQQINELFESDYELANAVYSAMGLTTINQSEITYTDEEGNLCAKMGGRSSKFTKGSQWEIVKDLKGYPSHAQGGVDIKLGKDGFSFTRDNGVIEAKHGLVLPKIK